MAKLRIIYAKSAIGYSQDQKDTIRSLGLRKLNSSVVRDDTPTTRGMIFKVQHLVRVEEVAETAAPAPVDATPLARPARRTALAAAPAQDDLKVIEGIGPKIAGVLNAAGITTYRQLAETDVARLSALLDEAGVRAPADPTTWPEQARLAADGDWDAFKRLTEELKAGRRVESAKEQ